MVTVPMSVDEMETQLSYLRVCTRIFFTSKSLFYKSINLLYNQVKTNGHKFKIRVALDDEYAAKFLYNLDSKVQCFLEE